MADQQRKPKPKKEEEEKAPEASKTEDETSSDMDELLDEIDEVLEANAEDFVRSYIQKGGQLVEHPNHLLPRFWRWAPA